MKYHRHRRATTISVYTKTFAISDTYNTHIVKSIVHTTYHENNNNDNNNNNKSINKEDADNDDNYVIIMMKIKMIIIGQCIFLMSDKL